MHNVNFSRLGMSILAASSVMLSACTMVGPDFVQPEPVVPMSDEFTDQGLGANPELYRSITPDINWWESMQDADLNMLIRKALKANTDLRVAMANLAGARSVLVESKTGLQPNLDIEASIQGQRFPSFQFGGGNQTLDDNAVTSLSLGLGWELDLFGRIRRSIEAAQYSIETQEALFSDMQRVIIADVAAAYIDYRGADRLLKVIEKNIHNQEETLQLTETMAEEGIVSRLDTTRARAQLTSTLSLLPTVVSDKISARNRLATLTSEKAGVIEQLLSKNIPLPILPAFINVGDPASLIRRRPDIIAAERSLAERTAQVGVATADLFPTISLTGTVGQTSLNPGSIFTEGAFNYAIGPGIRWNLFNRSAIKARIRLAEANVDVQLAQYDRVVLNALEEINTALVRHQYERQRNVALKDSVSASRESVELVRERYNAGAESFLSVLDAERTLLDSERQLTESNILLNLSLIQIYRSLSGSWEVE